jgi:hypothetical protein
MLECAASSSDPPHECVPNSVLSPELSREKTFLESPLENKDILSEFPGRSVSIRNADDVLSEFEDTRKGDSPIISCFVGWKGVVPSNAPPPIGAPEVVVDVILSKTASAIDEGRSPCALLPTEIVRSPTPNLDLSIARLGGDWGRNSSFPFSPMGTNALPLPIFGGGVTLDV